MSFQRRLDHLPFEIDGPSVELPVHVGEPLRAHHLVVCEVGPLMVLHVPDVLTLVDEQQETRHLVGAVLDRK